MKLEEYNPLMQLQKWNAKWEENEIYKWDNNASREESYVIDTPPPTVSGLLHMGHIFSYTQADFIARYQRMKGMAVCYPIGFDDNGLPTERLVEKVKNIRATSMSRSEFVEICKEVVEESEEEFRKLFKSVGLSFDWNLEYQTISKASQKISQMSFLDMVAKNRVYRKMQPTLWDVVDQTALAQADIEDKEQTSMMNDVKFQTITGEDIIIATTRPELIPACVAVMYNPNDERYKHLANKKAVTALFKAEVPFVADELVDMEKGTGLVMCCSFGDITDTIWWKKHKLDTKVIIDKYGKISQLDFFETEEAKNYAEMICGLKVKEARSKIIEILKEQNLILKQVETKPMVKCAERSGAPIEIILTPQWFVQILDRKEQLLEKAAECNWYPNYMKIRLDNWINGLNWDWCISRQRFFGVPFPVWYSKRPGEEGKVLFASKEQLPIDPLVDLPVGYTKDEVEPDYDVMDTWATSSVSPQLTSLGINDEFYVDLDRHKKLFPADLRPQAHEIIRSWAFYTLVKADIHENNIPWKNLMISGWCLAADKTKMSKSKGNVVTPTKLIEEKGTDIVRYWASTSRLGADTAYSEDVLKIGKKLVNKIWNAAKFAAIHLEKIKSKPAILKELIDQKIIKNSIDLWLLSKLALVVEKATLEFERLEYCVARTYIEEFFYKDFCDNYLEMVKVRAYDENNQDEAGKMSAIYTIYHAFSTMLKLFAPFIPYITEEIYAVLFAKYEENFRSIHAGGMWPNIADFKVIDSAILEGKVAIDILDVIRKIKAEQNISLKAEVKEILVINNPQKNYSDIVANIKNDLLNVTNALNIEIVGDADHLANIYHTEDGEMKLAVQL